MNVVLYNDQYHRFVHIIKQSESPAEFEQQWINVMETTKLGNNEWLSSLFEIRSRWVPAYVKHVFVVGMSSSQRSESGHSFLKKYVDRKNSLTYFVARFDIALVHQRHEELAANHIDLTQTPKYRVIPTSAPRGQASTKLKCTRSRVLSQAEHLIELVRHIMLSYAASDLVDEGPLTDARSTFLLSEFQNLRIRVKDIDTGDDVGMSRNRNRNKSVEETQVICDPNPVRVK
ncbi:Protein FAR-RED IMPAIRED RESPONSE 1 [Abeliophyllum distichum]|uniref:Protein FAR1-RELATED SEQUENCE n=1 Tax=Abeliophyllum distichum TaxID=126358 RepID=A0ABD1TIZ8_9LAMI